MLTKTGEQTTGDLKPIANSIFTLIKPQLDANNKRYLNSKKGGAPKGNKNAKNNLKTTEGQPNVNDNVNDNVNEFYAPKGIDLF